MALKLIVVGKTKEKFYEKSESEYLKRLTKFCKLQYLVVSSSKQSQDREECLHMESISIAKYIGESDFVVLLDEHGDEYTSQKWANRMNEYLVRNGNVVFIIGGAFGFSDDIKMRANAMWSLSKLTFPHHLVRTIFLEQIYRAFTILNGGKYHND